MRIGAQVSSSGGLVKALDRGDAIGAEVVQIFVQSPRMFRPTVYSTGELEAYREAKTAHRRIRATFAHAPYLINLASPDRELVERSQAVLAHSLRTVTAIGGDGVVVHIGSHLGHGLDRSVIGHIIDNVNRAFEAAADGNGEVCPLLLENTAGAGGTIGRSFSELASLIDHAGGDSRLQLCVDTQHLFAAGVAYATIDEADAVVAEIDRSIGLERLALVHLNDSKVSFGSNRDRHENLGEGEIGIKALGTLLSHPAFAAVPAVLEIPGSGHGPRTEDLDLARQSINAVAICDVAAKAGHGKRQPHTRHERHCRR